MSHWDFEIVSAVNGPDWCLLRVDSVPCVSTLRAIEAQLVKNLPAMQETLVLFLGQEYLLEKGRLPIPAFLGFPCGSAGKESTRNAGDLGFIPGLERSLREGKGYPLQYSGLENSMDCIVHGVTKSWTRLSDFHFHVRNSPKLETTQMVINRRVDQRIVIYYIHTVEYSLAVERDRLFAHLIMWVNFKTFMLNKPS